MSFSLRRVPGQDQPRHHSAQSPAFWPEAFSTTLHGPTIQANAARHVTKSPAFGPEAFTARHDVTRLRHTSLHAAQSPASGPEAFRTRPYAALRIASNRDTPLRQHRPKGRKLSTPSPHVTKPHKSNLCGTQTPVYGREAFGPRHHNTQLVSTSRFRPLQNKITRLLAGSFQSFTRQHSARLDHTIQTTALQTHPPEGGKLSVHGSTQPSYALLSTITGLSAGSFFTFTTRDETTPRTTNLYGTLSPAFRPEAFQDTTELDTAARNLPELHQITRLRAGSFHDQPGLDSTTPGETPHHKNHRPTGRKLSSQDTANRPRTRQTVAEHDKPVLHSITRLRAGSFRYKNTRFFTVLYPT